MNLNDPPRKEENLLIMVRRNLTRKVQGSINQESNARKSIGDSVIYGEQTKDLGRNHSMANGRLKSMNN